LSGWISNNSNESKLKNMSNIVTHLGQNLPWIGFKNGHNQYTITFTSGGSAFDISTYTFTVNIRKYGASTNALQLTQGSGITNGGATGILTIALTQTQASTTLPASDYFYEITYVKDSKTYALIQGGLTLSSESNPASTTTSVAVSVSLAGSAVNAEVTLAGAGGGSTAAEDIAFAPAGNIAATDVQAAIEELDSEKASAASLTTHTSNTSNPHSVTKTQVGLGNVDNTSDADKPVSTAQQTALDAKVPTSRTVNGQALSANVTIPHSLNYFISGRYISSDTNQIAVSTVAISANTIRAYPIIISRSLTIDEFRIEITTGVASTTARVSIYADNGSTYPGAIVSSSDVATYDSSVATTVANTPSSNITLTPGLYWLGINSNGAPTLRAIQPSSMPAVIGRTSSLANTHGIGYSIAQAYGAMPSTFPASAAVIVSPTNTPLIALRIV
jgi:hypothetical protein